MRRISAFLVALLVLGLVPGASSSGAQGPWRFEPRGITKDRFKVVEEPEIVEVEAHDGVMLYTRVYRPATPKSFKTPVILVHSPYYNDATSETNERSMDLVEFFNPKGYTVVLSDIRGTGNSGGCNEQDGPNQAEDFKTLVEYFDELPWTGKVGSYGKSYDAEAQNAGGVLAPKGLETMVTVAAISGLYDVAYFDGVPLGPNGLLSAGVYAANNPIPGDRPERSPERATCQHENVAFGADPRGDMSEYWKEREFRYGVKNVNASVLYVTGLQDGTVTPINIDGWYDQLPTFKRAIFGYWGHFYPYDAPEAEARNDWYRMIHAWFDHELLGLDTKIGRWPPVQVQDENNVWRAAKSFKAMGVKKAYVLGSETLGGRGEEGATQSFTEDTETRWSTTPFKAPVHVSGQAVLKATIAIDRPDAHFAISLQEQLKDGTVETLTAGYLSAMHRDSLESPEMVPLNETIKYRIRTYPFDDWVAKGSLIQLVISGSDDGTTPAGTSYTAQVAIDGSSKFLVPFVRRACGLKVSQTQAPRGKVPGCTGAQRRALLR